MTGTQRIGRLGDKVCIVTGGGSGLGRDAAQLFASEGAIVIAADVNAARSEETAALITAAGGQCVAATANVATEAEVASLCDRAIAEFGRLDVMMANAGIVSATSTTPFDEITEDEWQRVIGVNLTGTFLTLKHAVRVMKPRRAGSIVVTSSLAALVAWPSVAPYVASKGGVNALVRAAALDVGGYGIRVNAICPSQGMSANFMMAADAPVLGKSYAEVAPSWDPMATAMPLKLDRPPSLRDNAYAALFLASDDSAYMSGVSMPTCDGGQLARVANSMNPLPAL